MIYKVLYGFWTYNLTSNLAWYIFERSFECLWRDAPYKCRLLCKSSRMAIVSGVEWCLKIILQAYFCLCTECFALSSSYVTVHSHIFRKRLAFIFSHFFLEKKNPNKSKTRRKTNKALLQKYTNILLINMVCHSTVHKDCKAWSF